MIPDELKEFQERSREDVIFDSLRKLSNEYYVYHSVSVAYVKDNQHNLRQTDFIVFHPKKGLMCIEAKAGKIVYENGTWYHNTNGKLEKMPHDGPFNQASSYTQLLLEKLKSEVPNAVKNCKLLYAVWFPSLEKSHCDKIMAPECDKNLLLTKEDLDDPTETIEKIFKLDPFNCGVITNSNKNSEIATALAPRFVINIGSFENDARKNRFVRLLRQQYQVLEFLSEQKSAVINGMAGTGKTLVAIERARRLSQSGDKVLFLCFTAFLYDDLKQRYGNNDQYKNVDFYTFSKFAQENGGFDINNANDSYHYCKEVISRNNVLKYKHVIIDEGQDLGISKELQELAETLKLHCDLQEGGTFYVFYDRMQAILVNYADSYGRQNNQRSLPSVIEDADCKITLYRNCRNTRKIATSSVSPFYNKKEKRPVKCEMMEPEPYDMDALLFNIDRNSIAQTTRKIINSLRQAGIEDIVILTVAPNEESSALSSYLTSKQKDNREKKYFENCWFTTSKKYKGLEAEAIIITDVNKDTFYLNNEEGRSKYYVAASRARTYLRVVSSLSDDDCREILKNVFGEENSPRIPINALTNKLGMIQGRLNV